MLKGISLLDCCLADLENASWRKEVVQREASTLSAKLEELESNLQQINAVLNAATIPEELSQMLLQQAEGEMEIEEFLSALASLEIQFVEFGQMKFEFHPVLFEATEAKFRSLFERIGKNIQRRIILQMKEATMEQLHHTLLQNESLYQASVRISPNLNALFQAYCRIVRVWFFTSLQEKCLVFVKREMFFSLSAFKGSILTCRNECCFERKLNHLLFSFLQPSMEKEWRFMHEFFCGEIHPDNLQMAFSTRIFDFVHMQNALSQIISQETDIFGLLLSLNLIQEHSTFPLFKSWLQTSIHARIWQRFHQLMRLEQENLKHIPLPISTFLQELGKIPPIVRSMHDFLHAVHSTFAPSEKICNEFAEHFIHLLEAKLRTLNQRELVFLLNVIDALNITSSELSTKRTTLILKLRELPNKKDLFTMIPNLDSLNAVMMEPREE